MNILKSSYLNSTTLKKNWNPWWGKIFLYGFFSMCKIFMDKLSLNVILLSPFIEIAKMFQDFANQNNTFLDYYSIHMCIGFIT
jgi:hypothetical protein